MLARPQVWGRDPDPRSIKAGSLDQAGRVVWALRQNVLVCGLNELKEFHGNSTADVAEVLGGSYSQLARKVAGEVPASYADMVRWEWLVRRGARQHGPVSTDVLDVLGPASIGLRSVAEASVTMPAWPLPKGNQKGGRPIAPPGT